MELLWKLGKKEQKWRSFKASECERSY